MSPGKKAGNKGREKKDCQVPVSRMKMREGLTIDSGLRGMNWSQIRAADGH